MAYLVTRVFVDYQDIQASLVPADIADSVDLQVTAVSVDSPDILDSAD